MTLECAGNGRARLLPRPVSQPWLHEAVGTMRWTGTPLAPLLREAGLSDRAVDVVFTGVDHGVERGEEQDYAARAAPWPRRCATRCCSPTSATTFRCLPQHGFPLRLVVPGWYGMAHVKWLRSIEVVDTPFDGYQQRAYSLRQEAGEPGTQLTRIDPRALVAPPGFPDFMSRTRFLGVGEHVLHGRAWSGWGPVDRVEVSTDDGATWAPAELEPPVGRVGLATVDLHLARGDPGPVRRVGPGGRRHRAHPAERTAVEPRWLQQHLAAAGRRRRRPDSCPRSVLVDPASGPRTEVAHFV